MIGNEAEIATVAGKVGGAGVVMYALIRFGPLLESLILRKGKKTEGSNGNGNGGQDQAAIKRRLQRLNYVAWDELTKHCERAHAAATDVMDRELRNIRTNLEGLGRDMRDLTKEIRNGKKTEGG